MLSSNQNRSLHSEVHKRHLQLAAADALPPEKATAQSPVDVSPWLGPPLDIGTVLAFRAGSDAVAFLQDGWSHPENDFTWTLGPAAQITIPPLSRRQDILLVVSGFPHAPGGRSQTISLLVDGWPVGTWTINAPGRLTAWMPASRVKLDRPSVLTLQISEPCSPRDCGLGADDRPLGFALQTIALLAF